jgi:hypothetical protein
VLAQDGTLQAVAEINSLGQLLPRKVLASA